MHTLKKRSLCWHNLIIKLQILFKCWYYIRTFITRAYEQRFIWNILEYVTIEREYDYSLLRIFLICYQKRLSYQERIYMKERRSILYCMTVCFLIKVVFSTLYQIRNSRSDDDERELYSGKINIKRSTSRKKGEKERNPSFFFVIYYWNICHK